jgi:hypothetical protein
MRRGQARKREDAEIKGEGELTSLRAMWDREEEAQSAVRPSTRNASVCTCAGDKRKCDVREEKAPHGVLQPARRGCKVVLAAVVQQKGCKVSGERAGTSQTYI